LAYTTLNKMVTVFKSNYR